MNTFNDICKNYVKDFLQLNKIQKRKFTVFTISTTAKQYDKNVPYFTPIRVADLFMVSGVVIYNIRQFMEILHIIDGVIDFIFIDVEMKINLADLNETDGNLSYIASKVVNKSHLIEFKPNDLTVNSVWSFVSLKKSPLYLKKVAIIGSGNIGSKLALKFLESGSLVKVFRRDSEKLKKIILGLNNAKPNYEGQGISISSSIADACKSADIVLGCSNSDKILEYSFLKGAKKDAIILDVGKGTISEETNLKLRSEGSVVYRTDIHKELESFITNSIQSYFTIRNSIPFRKIDGNNIISSGVLGIKGDVIVRNGKEIVGICDGKGDLIRENSKYSDKLLNLKKKLNTKVRY